LNKLVESINIDGVFYTENGSRNTVRVGQSITGLSASAAVETSAVPVTVSYEKPVAVEIVDSSAIRIIDKPDEKTLLERLRLRRQREMQ
jgi:pyruvate/2-oxoglutarate/acetoin dehydrogenase E1 component